MSAVLAVVGIVTPVAFVLSLLFPFWVAAAATLLMRASHPTAYEGEETQPTTAL